MAQIDKQKVREELKRWASKLEQLKLKGTLLKMEARDRKDEVVGQLEKHYREAQTKFHAFTEATDSEVERTGKSFQAAWDAFKSTWKKSADED